MRNPIVEKFIKNLFGGGCENTALVGVPCNSIRELCDKIAPPPEHVPEGFEWTGEMRQPETGEFFVNSLGKIEKAEINLNCIGSRYILRSVKTLHTFDEAMRAYANGANVRRKGWGRENMENRVILRWDVIATDWLIEEEK